MIDWQTMAMTILGWETGQGLWRFAAHNRQPRNAHEREHLQHERDVRNSGPYRGGYPGPWVDWGHAAECRVCALPENRERKKVDYSWLIPDDERAVQRGLTAAAEAHHRRAPIRDR